MKRALFYLSIIFLCNEFGMAQSGSDAGSTPASFEVSASGAATYTIPFALPPGIKDIVPPVALSYSSQGGNGIAGWGWNISGLSTITRMPSSQYHDGEIHPVNFSATDRFALDGQRLMLKSGTYGAPDSEYQTENYSNLKIKAYGTSRYGANYGPAYFLIFYPDGSRAWYGSEWASNNRLEWSIYKWQDAQGNYMLYDYTNTGNLLRLESIKYGSRSGTSAPNEIRFYYKTRSRPEQSFIGGINFTRKDLLNTVEVTTGGLLYRKYNLIHEVTPGLAYDRLVTVQEVNGNGQTRPAIYFKYDDTPDTFEKVNTFMSLNTEISVETDQMASGDFDGDGRMDFITYKSNNTGNVNAFTQIGNNGTMVSFEAYGSDPERTAAFASTILTSEDKIPSWQALTTISETKNTSSYASTVKFRQARFFINSFSQEYTKEWSPTAYVYQNYCNDGTRRAIPKEYIPGDFNGDGLTDVMAVNQSYSTRYCRTGPTGGGGGQPKLQGTSSQDSTKVDSTNSNYKGDTGSCSCTTNTVNNGQVNFIDLDRRKTSNFANTAGYLNSTAPWAYGDRFYAINFNGDTKTELLHLKEGKVLVYELTSSNTLNLLYEHTDAYLKRSEALLFGDFNGDGKTDMAAPTAAGSTIWKFFIANGLTFTTFTKDIQVDYRRNGVFSSSFNGASSLQQAVWEYHYIVQDFNGDGKADILKQTVITSLENESLSKEYISIYENKHSNQHNYPGFERSLDHFEENNGIRKYGIPVFLDIIKSNANLEYAYIDKDRVWAYTFEKNHKEEVLVREIDHNGQKQVITYHDLGVKETSQTEGTYIADTDQAYPYVNIALAPSLTVVKEIKETGEGITRNQLFKYRNGVSHAEGIGFLGFTLVQRTNVHGDNVPRLWYGVQTSPQLRGAVIHEWSSPTFLSQPPDGSNLSEFINRTTYSYQTILLPNKVFSYLPAQVVKQDALLNTLETESYTYDAYYNISQLTVARGQGSSTTDFTYSNNPSSESANYHIGIITQKIETNNFYGNTMTATEQFTYVNNLISQRKYKGHQTDWIQEDFTYDLFGNRIQKTVSATGESSRTESYTYDAGGRFMTESTNVEGLTVSMNYDGFGNLIQTTDAFGKSTGFGYDGWNRLISQTDFLGNQTTILYQGTATGGLIKTTNSPDGGRYSETYNVFGWTVEIVEVSLNNQEIRQLFNYDIAGKVLEESEPFFSSGSAAQWNRSTYDLYGRLISYQTPTGKIITTTYNEKTVIVDDGTKVKSTTVDDLGNVITATDPGGTITYTYHPNNELKTASYNDNVVSILIDGWGRKTELNDPSAGKYTYIYNAFGELIQETTPTGVTDYTLDANGKTQQKKITGNETNMTINYTYDGTTKMLTAISGVDAQFGKSYQYTYSYDSYQRPVSVIENNDAAIFETRTGYDALGRAESTEYRTTYKNDNSQSNVKIRNLYSPEGILHELKDWGSGTSLWKLNSQNHRGQPLEIQLGNGYKKTRQYDPYGLPKQIRDYKPSTSQEALNLQYDFNAQRGLLNSRGNTAFNWNESFSYDTHDRLTQISGAVNQSQQYDAMGRFTSKSDVGGYTYDTNKKYRITELDLNASGDTWFQNHSLQQVTYNAFKTPVEVIEQGHGRVSFEYNPMMGRSHAWFGGEQANKQERRYRKHYSAVSPVEIRVDTQAGTVKITTFIGGDAYTAPVALIRQFGSGAFNAYHYLHRDYLGSILAITDSSGTIREQRQFGAWGTVDKFVNNRNETEFGHESSLINRGFTGHEHFFGVNLIHMNGRMYDAVLGRFLSPDNYVQDPYNTQSFNRYGYVWNNPLSYNDPSGEFLVSALIGAAIGVLTNGINNVINDRPFFRGAGKAALFGFMGGAVSFGIGHVAGMISNTYLSVAYQVGMHGLTGGMFSGAQGGTFGSGFLSGALSSGISSAVSSVKIDSNFWSASFKIASTGLSGGLGSVIGGGNFIDGVRQGLITGTLNHGVHSGWFGTRVAIAAVTGRIRHLFGADALSITINGIAAPVLGIKMEKGVLLVLRGPDAGTAFSLDGLAGVIGLPTLSGEISITELYYSGSLKSISMDVLTGSYVEFNLGGDLGISLGSHVSYSDAGQGQITLGIGVSYGIGFSPVLGLDANVQIGISSMNGNPFK
jgi:RHS repeat-associated protein